MTTPSDTRTWMSSAAITREAEILAALDLEDPAALDARLHSLVEENKAIHDLESINLNPASNVMNPRAEALLASGMTTRASLGHAGDKYEMGLEAIEEIEVIAAAAARRVLRADHVEFRVPSGAIANLYAFMATCRPGDAIIVPPASVGGHITHRDAGAAGLFGLEIHECPIDPGGYTIDVAGLAALAERVEPKLITIGMSLNLLPHPVADIRSIADAVGAKVLFDAAHACGMILGGVWPHPLEQGADLMTMSTYKSLGGPAGGLVATNDTALAGRLDAIAYPGLTANFDVAKTAALAITMLDWSEHGPAYAQAMAANAAALAAGLEDAGLPVFRTRSGPTTTHQLAIVADGWGGGHQAAMLLRRSNLLSCAIGLPTGGEFGGLRLGTPEVTRLGMTEADMTELAGLIAEGLLTPDADTARRVSDLRRRFSSIHYIRR